jgi:hypothetical protein
VTLLDEAFGIRGCFRGRPLGLLGLGCSGGPWELDWIEVEGIGDEGASWRSSMQKSSSSRGSTLATVTISPMPFSQTAS